jgi:hypothetical protein
MTEWFDCANYACVACKVSGAAALEDQLFKGRNSIRIHCLNLSVREM